MVLYVADLYILNDYAYTSSVTAMLNKISLPTLESHRKIRAGSRKVVGGGVGGGALKSRGLNREAQAARGGEYERGV